MANDLDARGFHVIVIDIHSSSEELSSNIDYIQFDLNKIDRYPELREKVKEKIKSFKCLINNAAYNPKIENKNSELHSFEDTRLENWERELTINLTSPVFLIKEMLPLFNQTDGAQCKIVNMSSIYGVVPPNQNIYKPLSKELGSEYIKPLSYSASKAALGMVTKYLAVYLGEKGL